MRDKRRKVCYGEGARNCSNYQMPETEGALRKRENQSKNTSFLESEELFR